jgi:hypothetical protein
LTNGRRGARQGNTKCRARETPHWYALGRASLNHLERNDPMTDGTEIGDDIPDSVSPRAVLIYVDKNGSLVPPPEYVPNLDEGPPSCPQSDRCDFREADFVAQRSAMAPFVKDIRRAIEDLLRERQRMRTQPVQSVQCMDDLPGPANVVD